MRRPLCVIGFAFPLTTLAAFLLSPGQVALLCALASALFLLCLFLRRRLGSAAALVLLSVALALACQAGYRHRAVAPFAESLGQTVMVEGLVIEAKRSPRAVFYTLEARFPESVTLPPTRLSLRCFGELEFGVGDVIGAQLLLDTELAQPFDYSFAQGGLVSGQALDAPRRLEGGYPLRRALLSLRGTMRANLYSHFPARTASLLSAMALGYVSEVDPTLSQALSRAGTGHLLSVSGLHLSVLVTLVLRLLGAARIPVRAARMAALFAALLFAGLVGFSASVTRALVMTGVILLAGMSARRHDSLSALALAVILISVLWPTWLLGRGFWFSASATLGILLLAKPIGRTLYAALPRRRGLWRHLARMLTSACSVSVGAYVFTLPFAVLFSGSVPLLSPVANVLISPLITPLLAGGMLCAAVGWEGLPMQIVAAVTGLCADGVAWVSSAIAALPIAAIPLDEAWMLGFVALLLVSVGLLVRLSPTQRRIAYSYTLCICMLFSGNLSHQLATRGSVELCVISDCGTAVLLRGGDAVLLGLPEKNEVTRLLRYLEFRSVQRICAVLAIESGEQIGSALPRLFARYPIDCVVGPSDAYSLKALSNALPGVPVCAGGGARLTVLGGVEIAVSQPDGELLITAGKTVIRKNTDRFDEAGIMEADKADRIALYPDGVSVLAGANGLEPTPVGKALYGETRFRFRL